MKKKEWIDHQCKRLLSNKMILVNILKRVIEEYQGLSDEEILELISAPQLSVNDDKDTLETRNAEDLSIINEPIYYDVLLYAGLPGSNDLIGLVINLEVQQRIPEYPIMKRVYYYLGRLIARQKGHSHGFQKSDYGRLKKVIGIWIVREKKERKGMVYVYRTQEKRYGTDEGYPKKEYDLMQAVVIAAKEKASEATGIMEFLSLLFGNQNDSKETVERLEKESGVVLSKKEKEDLEEMCNWSMSYYLDGVEDGEEKGRNEGKAEEKRQVVRRLTEAGVSMEVIAAAATLSTAEIMTILS